MNVRSNTGCYVCCTLLSTNLVIQEGYNQGCARDPRAVWWVVGSSVVIQLELGRSIKWQASCHPGRGSCGG